jgi:hypothetical protein
MDALAYCIAQGKENPATHAYLTEMFPEAELPRNPNNVSVLLNAAGTWQRLLELKGWPETKVLWSLHQQRQRVCNKGRFTEQTLAERVGMEDPEPDEAPSLRYRAGAR